MYNPWNKKKNISSYFKLCLNRDFVWESDSNDVFENKKNNLKFIFGHPRLIYKYFEHKRIMALNPYVFEHTPDVEWIFFWSIKVPKLRYHKNSPIISSSPQVTSLPTTVKVPSSSKSSSLYPYNCDVKHKYKIRTELLFSNSQ